MHLKLVSTNTSDSVMKVLSRIGICVSPYTGSKMIEPLADSHMKLVQHVCHKSEVACIYDNVEFSFNNPEPTRTKSQTLKSITALTFVPLLHVPRNSLQCSQYVWDRNFLNRHCQDRGLRYRLTLDDILLTQDQLFRLKQRFAWHIRSMLINNHPSFKKFVNQLGLPLPSSPEHRIPIQKTYHYPGRMVDATESAVSGNVQVLEAIRKQAGVALDGEKLLATGKVMIMHADLGTIEKIESLQQSHSIEMDKHSNAVQRFQYVIPVFGMFHVRMGCAEALCRLYLPDEKSHLDETSSYKHIAFMRPKEAEKFKSNPGYCQGSGYGLRTFGS
jgi:hypothetical protein